MSRDTEITAAGPDRAQDGVPLAAGDGLPGYAVSATWGTCPNCHALVSALEQAAFLARHVRESGVPDHPAVNTVHDVEPGANHVIVLAQAKGARDREALRVKRGDHLVFAVHRVSRGQQLARRLAAQHIILAGRD
mgnify:CR=1 FL=1